MRRRLLAGLACFAACVVIVSSAANAQREIPSSTNDSLESLGRSFGEEFKLAGLRGPTQGQESYVADTFFTTEYLLPQTLSKENLSAFLSMEHKEYHLDGWFFMGNLIEGKGPVKESQIRSFLFSVQRKDIAQVPGTPVRFSIFPSIGGTFGSKKVRGVK